MDKHLPFIPRFILIFVLTLGGCVIHHPDYPSKWAALNMSESDGCIMIAGDYQENGEPAEPITFYDKDRQPVLSIPHLSQFLLQYRQTTAQLTRVTLSYPDRGVLEVAAYENQKLIAKAQYREKENAYACEDGVVKILSFHGSPASQGAPMVGYMSSAVYLYKAMDDSLVLRDSGNVVGLAFLFVPAGSSETRWYRFMPISVQVH